MTVRLTASSVSARRAREAVATAVVELGRGDLADPVMLVASELVANAVLHARTDMTLSLTAVPDGVRVAVADGSPVLPRWTPSAATATSGRGLLLVARLCDTWGVDPEPGGGKVMWAVVTTASTAVAYADEPDVLAPWTDEPWPVRPPEDELVEVRLDVDVARMLASRAHTEDLVRELQLTLHNDACPVTRGDHPARGGRLRPPPRRRLGGVRGGAAPDVRPDARRRGARGGGRLAAAAPAPA